MFESPWHWLVVAIVAFVLFFGWKQLPDMSRSVGRSLRIFKTEMKGMGDDDAARENAKTDGVRETTKHDTAGAAVHQPKALPKAEVVAPAGSRPRPRPAPNRAAAGSRPE